MTDTTQPEALRLAQFFESMKGSSHRWHDGTPVHEKAAAELIRLHANERDLTLLLALEQAECRDLRAQLSAIGAGGVESLRKRDGQQPQAWLVHIPSSDTQNVYDSQDDCGYIDDLTNNDDAVVTPLYAARAAQPARECLQQSAALTDAEMRAGFQAAHEHWTFEGMTAWNIWRKACQWAALQAAPPAPAAVAVLTTQQIIDRFDFLEGAVTESTYRRIVETAESIQRAALAAAPAQAVAQGINIDFKQATELLEMFGGEPAEITLMTGNGHSGNGLYASYTDMPEEGAGFLGTSDDEALPAAPAQAVAVPAFEAVRMFWAQHGSQSVLDMGTLAELHSDVERTIRQHTPAQEHATQLAGQGQQPAAWLASYQDREGNEASYVTTHYALAVENDARGAPVALYPAAPAQAQEDARDADAIDTLAYALELFVGGNALHSLCAHEPMDAMGRVKGTWSAAAEANARAALRLCTPNIDAARAAQGGA